MKISFRNIITGIASDFWAATLKNKSLIIELAISRFRFIWSIVSAVFAVSLFGMTSALAGGIIFNSDFESGGIKGWARHDGRLPGAITVQSGVKRAGKYAVKLHMKRCAFLSPKCKPAPVNLGAPRSQLGVGGGVRFAMNKSYWLGYSAFIPTSWVFDARSHDSLFNLHKGSRQGPGGCTAAPQPLGWRIHGNRWQFLYTKNSSNHSAKNDIAPVEKGRWTDWVINFKFSHGNDGFFKIWKNGKRVYSYNGITICKGSNTSGTKNTLPYMNAPIYKSEWRNSPNIKERTLYYDEIRVGNSSASYKDVVPRGAAKAGGTTTSAPARKSTNAAKRQPVATKGKRRLYSSCNKLRGKKRDACARQIRAYNRSIGYAG